MDQKKGGGMNEPLTKNENYVASCYMCQKDIIRSQGIASHFYPNGNVHLSCYDKKREKEQASVVALTLKEIDTSIKALGLLRDKNVINFDVWQASTSGLKEAI